MDRIGLQFWLSVSMNGFLAIILIVLLLTPRYTVDITTDNPSDLMFAVKEQDFEPHGYLTPITGMIPIGSPIIIHLSHLQANYTYWLIISHDLYFITNASDELVIPYVAQYSSIHVMLFLHSNVLVQIASPQFNQGSLIDYICVEVSL